MSVRDEVIEIRDITAKVKASNVKYDVLEERGTRIHHSQLYIDYCDVTKDAFFVMASFTPSSYLMNAVGELVS